MRAVKCSQKLFFYLKWTLKSLPTTLGSKDTVSNFEHEIFAFDRLKIWITFNFFWINYILLSSIRHGFRLHEWVLRLSAFLWSYSLQQYKQKSLSQIVQFWTQKKPPGVKRKIPGFIQDLTSELYTKAKIRHQLYKRKIVYFNFLFVLFWRQLWFERDSQNARGEYLKNKHSKFEVWIIIILTFRLSDNTRESQRL